MRPRTARRPWSVSALFAVGFLAFLGIPRLHAQVRERPRVLPVDPAVAPHVYNNAPDQVRVVGLDFHFQRDVVPPYANVQAPTWVYVGHAQQLLFFIENMTSQPIANLQVRVRKIAGPGSYDQSRTIGVLATGNSWVGLPLSQPFWVAEAGEHKFEVILDSGNTLHEAAPDFTANNRIEKTVVPLSDIIEQAVEPSAFGPADALFFLNIAQSGCSGFIEPSDDSVRVELYYTGPKPAPADFAGCEARPEFYRGLRLANDWTVARISPAPPRLHRASVGLPSASGIQEWLHKPEGNSLHTQVLLRNPSPTAVVSMELRIVVSGPVGRHYSGVQ